MRKGKHGARSAKQAIAIGLSKARRAGGKLPLPPGRKAITATGRRPNPACSRAAHRALEREGSASVSHKALSRHPRSRAQGPRRRTNAEDCGESGPHQRRGGPARGCLSGQRLWRVANRWHEHYPVRPPVRRPTPRGNWHRTCKVRIGDKRKCFTTRCVPGNCPCGGVVGIWWHRSGIRRNC
ncbi:MAG: DUF6496 domain-containing protein [Bryobacteraceae bacterium]